MITVAALLLAACGDDDGQSGNNNNDVSLTCGNGIVEGIEECDDGVDNSDTVADACRTSCLLPHCGDGVIDAGEVCDDGPANSDEVPDACRESCEPAGCGDGVVDVRLGESCDHGGTPDEYCSSVCLVIYCGNGIVDPGELCDDGNFVGGDGCSPDCLSDETCGNGRIDTAAGELCDDGNRRSRDGCSSTCRPEAALWQQWSGYFEAGRYDHHLVYDAARDVTVLFGGLAQGTTSDTWEWDGTQWHAVITAQEPPGRRGHRLVYDSARGTVLLLAGEVWNVNYFDVWEYDGVDWTEVPTTNAPPKRTDFAAVYDPQADRVVLYGGRLPNYTPFDDTWEYDPATAAWVETSPAASPGARYNTAAAYSAQSQRVTVFGGTASGVRTDETWAYNASNQTWTQLSAGTPPTGRTGAEMVYDSARGLLVVFGGHPAGTSQYSNELWELGGTGWQQRSPGNNPAGRVALGLAYDVQRQRTVMFAGLGNSSVHLADTWEYDGTDWTERTPQQLPAERKRLALAYDTARGRTVLFGGSNTTMLGDTWEFDGRAWVDVSPAVTPTAREWHSMAYDSVRERVVLFGGAASDSLGDTWEFDGVTWTETTPATSPSDRRLAHMAFDSHRDVMVLYGGSENWNGPVVGGTWEYDGLTWTEITTTGDPGPRANGMMVYDAARRVMLLYGGGNGSENVDEHWEYDGTTATWSERTLAVKPAAIASHPMVYDPYRGRTLLFANHITWEFTGQQWVKASPIFSVTGREWYGATFDVTRRALVMFGGVPLNGETWEYVIAADYDEEDCYASGDEDGDGLDSCDDPDCTFHPACSGQPHEQCDNGADDDGDGLTDCADPNCGGFPCLGAGPGVCFAGQCCVGDATESDCGDGVDNDCDGLYDCQDDDCLGQPGC